MLQRAGDGLGPLTRLSLALAIFLAACGGAAPAPHAADIEVFGGWRGEDADAFRQTLATFTAQTGITIGYTGTSDIVGDLEERISRADTPDLAILPRPGFIRDLFRSGSILALPEEVNEIVAANYRPDAAEITAVDGISTSVMIRASVKDLVWYRPDHFAEHGYAIPEEWGDLLNLTQRMQDDGMTPWCMGLEAFGASGWPGTDWVEQIVLGAFPPEIYDRWVAYDVAFTEAEIRDAFDLYATLALKAGWALGGRRGVLNTPASEAVLPMFDEPQECGMHRQASFIAEGLPEGTEIGPNGDVDVFSMPGFPGIDPPLHVGGDFAVAFKDDARVWALMHWLASPESARAWPGGPGNVAPHVTFEYSSAADPFSHRIADMLVGAESVRFDASDLFSLRTGEAFNEGILQLIATGNVEAATEAIQAVAEQERRRLYR